MKLKMVLILIFFFIFSGDVFGMELSYWLRMDINSNQNARGYWHKYTDKTENGMPTQDEVNRAVEVLVKEYRANKLYLIYHRQFEMERMKTLYLRWKQAVNRLSVGSRPEIVPVLVLREYGHNDETNWNFSDDELIGVVGWLKSNVNNKELGIFDVYFMNLEYRNVDRQLALIKEKTGLSLIRLGLQPLERLSTYFDSAVEDMWEGESAGESNDLWLKSPVCDDQKTGKEKVKSWINRRVHDERRIAYLLVAVAWDYDFVRNKSECVQLRGPGYDMATKNDVIPVGRLNLVELLIKKSYEDVGRINFGGGGLSSDLVILNDSSRVLGIDRDGVVDNSLYTKLKRGERYTGRWSRGLDEIGAIFGKYNPNPFGLLPTKTPTPTPTKINQKPGDFDGDGIVGVLDYSVWLGKFNQGTMTIIDYSVWYQGFVQNK